MKHTRALFRSSHRRFQRRTQIPAALAAAVTFVLSILVVAVPARAQEALPTIVVSPSVPIRPVARDSLGRLHASTDSSTRTDAGLRLRFGIGSQVGGIANDRAAGVSIMGLYVNLGAQIRDAFAVYAVASAGHAFISGHLHGGVRFEITSAGGFALGGGIGIDHYGTARICFWSCGSSPPAQTAVSFPVRIGYRATSRRPNGSRGGFSFTTEMLPGVTVDGSYGSQRTLSFGAQLMLGYESL